MPENYFALLVYNEDDDRTELVIADDGYSRPLGEKEAKGLKAFLEKLHPHAKYKMYELVEVE